MCKKPAWYARKNGFRSPTPPAFAAAASLAAPSGAAQPEAVAVRGPTAAGLAVPAFAAVATRDPVSGLSDA